MLIFLLIILTQSFFLCKLKNFLLSLDFKCLYIFNSCRESVVKFLYRNFCKDLLIIREKDSSYEVFCTSKLETTCCLLFSVLHRCTNEVYHYNSERSESLSKFSCFFLPSLPFCSEFNWFLFYSTCKEVDRCFLSL